MDLEGQPARDASQNAEQGALNQSVTEPIFFNTRSLDEDSNNTSIS